MKASFNDKINKTVVRTGALFQKFEHYMGYPTLYQEGQEFYLSYHYGKVYFNWCRYNNNGWRSGGGQCPLSSLTNKNSPDWIKAAKIAFRRDKKLGIIDNNYKFV